MYLSFVPIHLLINSQYKFHETKLTNVLELETVKNVALVESGLLKDHVITPKQSREQHSTIERELYIKSLIFYFILQQITRLKFEEHKNQGAGGSYTPLYLWSDPQWFESNQIDSSYLGLRAN